jgi:hypothetical protein
VLVGSLEGVHSYGRTTTTALGLSHSSSGHPANLVTTH